MRIATIADDQKEYGEKVYRVLKEKNMRVEKDFRNEKLGFKVREAQLEKIPYLLVIGNNEVETGTVAPRKLGGKNLSSMTIEDFLNHIEKELDPQKWQEVE